MSYWPTRGNSGRALLDALSQVHNGAQNIFAGGHESTDVINNYLKWCADSTRMLQLLLTSEQLQELVLTRAYTEIRSDPSGPAKILLGTIYNEVPRRITVLDEAVRELAADLKTWSTAKDQHDLTFVVPDTNVLLHHLQQLDEIDWHAEIGGDLTLSTDLRVVVPLVVVDELDDAKRGQQRSRARATLKLLWDKLDADVHASPMLHPKTPPAPGARVAPGEVRIQLLMDPDHHIRQARADDELVDRTVALQSFRGHPVRFLTYDTGAAFRARAAGLTTQRLVEPDPGPAGPRKA